MKPARKTFALLLLLAGLFGGAYGQANLIWVTNSAQITITDWTGSPAEITIPDHINGLPVTEIGEFAFINNETLSSVTFGTNVVEIGFASFQACISLSSITIPSGVTNLGSYAFYGCRGLSGVTMPDSVKSIGIYAFAGCIGLSSFTIPPGVSTISDRVFWGCIGLAEIRAGAGVSSVYEGAFANCTNLASIYFSGAAPEFDPNTFAVFDEEDSNVGAIPATAYILAGADGWPTPPAGVGSYPSIPTAYYTPSGGDPLATGLPKIYGVSNYSRAFGLPAKRIKRIF